MPRKTRVNIRLDEDQEFKGFKPIQTEQPTKYRIVQGDSKQTKVAVHGYMKMLEEEARKMPALYLGSASLIKSKTPSPKPVILASRASSPNVSPLLGAQTTKREFSPFDLLIKEMESEKKIDGSVLCTEDIGESYFNEFSPSDLFVKDKEFEEKTDASVLCTEDIEECFSGFNEVSPDSTCFNFGRMRTLLTFGDGAGSITGKTKPLFEKD